MKQTADITYIEERKITEKDRSTIEVKPRNYQPSKAELDESVNIGTTPGKLEQNRSE